MKIFPLLLFAITVSTGIKAQTGPKSGGPRKARRVYQILVENERNANNVQDQNNRLAAMQEQTRSNTQRGLFGDLLWAGLATSLKQKTVSSTSNIVGLGIDYAQQAIKGSRDMWYRKAQQQCYFNQVLAAETKIDDFYAQPSTKGSMDPENMKFQGFGCKSYIVTADADDEGVGVLYLFCRIRRDSIGLRHIVNHSKFLVEVDSLVFNPKYCNLPNDSTGNADNRFSFDKRDKLKLQLKARFFSSWMNQATMITDNQQLGEFVVNVDIDKNKLNKDGLFVYDKHNPAYQHLVSIDGDCFVVPRSYTGTNDGVTYQPSWGTGQYRVEMEITERCAIVDSYYQVADSTAATGKSPADNSAPAKKKWNKAKWKTEWKMMNKRKPVASPFRQIADCVVSAYKGNGWMATITDPVTTALYSWETTKLGEWINNVHETKVAIPAQGAPASQSAAASQASQGSQGSPSSQATNGRPGNNNNDRGRQR